MAASAVTRYGFGSKSNVVGYPFGRFGVRFEVTLNGQKYTLSGEDYIVKASGMYVVPAGLERETVNGFRNR